MWCSGCVDGGPVLMWSGTYDSVRVLAAAFACSPSCCQCALSLHTHSSTRHDPAPFFASHPICIVQANTKGGLFSSSTAAKELKKATDTVSCYELVLTGLQSLL